MDPAAQWAVSASDFPRGGGAGAQLAFLVRYAILAPSGHNTQPWRFRVEGETLMLLADRSRRLPAVDPDDRALIISNGAALGMLRAAMRFFGHGGEILLLPDAADRDLLAHVRLGKPYRPTARDRARFEAIRERRTTRRDFAADPLPQGLIRSIAALGEGGARVALVTYPAGKARLAGLVADGDRAQFADPAFRRELAAWVRSRRCRSRDGMSGANFGFPDLASPIGGLAIRYLDMGKMVAEQDRKRVERAPALALVLSADDQPRDWLEAGMVHADMLLDVTVAGFTAAYCNQPIETASLRPKLAAAAGVDGSPQLLLRLGKGPAIAPAVRRPVEAVIGH